MKLGLVAFAENTGLGNQSKLFYDNLHPEKTLVLDRREHFGRDFRPEWYPGATFVPGLPTYVEIDTFLGGLDVVLMFEITPTDYLLQSAREKDVKTLLMVNYEYCKYLTGRRPRPDLFLVPSLWHFKDQPDPKRYAPVPITVFESDMPDCARNFLHIAGHPLARDPKTGEWPDRNGTRALLAALKHIKSSIVLTLRCQERGYLESLLQHVPVPDNVELVLDEHIAPDWRDNYKDQHVLIMPRRFGGLCLPVNEAIGFGMPVLMPDISPNNAWLPSDWMIPAQKVAERHMAAPIGVYDVDAKLLAAKIDQLASDSAFFGLCTAQAREVAHDYSWDLWRLKYVSLLQNMLPLAVRE